MKPLLVICPGLAKSGTTSLYIHLRDSKILHFGHGKEHYYLNVIYQNNYSGEEQFKNNFHEHNIRRFFKDDYQFKSFEDYYNKRTLENYKNYFLEIHDYYVNQTNQFYGVADFSQNYETLTLENVVEFRDYIIKHFNVKIILMIRDPIRRLYSYCNMVVEQKDVKKHFYHILTDKLENFYYTKINSFFIKKWGSDVWGENNSKIFFYEDLFDCSNTKNCKILHEFLNVPYFSINVNNNVLKATYFNQLTEDDIKFAKSKLKDEYTYIHKMTNYLPSKWE
jgi:hypothetical protein